MKQNKKRQKTLDSAQCGLEIIFKVALQPLDNLFSSVRTPQKNTRYGTVKFGLELPCPWCNEKPCFTAN